MTSSADTSRAQCTEWAAHMGQSLNHVICAATRVAPGRYAVLLGLRDGWGSHSERERGFLELLKPHFMQAWMASCVPEPPITPTQRRVLELVRDGHTNRLIARDLGIGEATVRTHLQNAYAALGVNNRVAAVTAAFGDQPLYVPAQRRGAD